VGKSKAEQEVTLKKLEDDLFKAQVQLVKLENDLRRAKLAVEVGKTRKENAEKEYDKARNECHLVDGKNPMEVALIIEAERNKNAHLIAALEKEEQEYLDNIKVGEKDYICTKKDTYSGILFTHSFRPACKPGYCCGRATSVTKDGIDNNDIHIETCQKIETTHLEWRAMRPKNAHKKMPI